jgi:hypothetical protein
MPGVLMPQQRDTIGDVAKGLQIAGSLYGIYTDQRKLDAAQQEAEAKAEKEARISKGNLMPDEYQTALKDFAPTPEGQEPELFYNVIDPATGQARRQGMTSRSTLLSQTEAEKNKIAREDRKEREKWELDFKKQQAEALAEFRKAMLNAQNAKLTAAADKPSTGQKQLDSKFAEKYAAYIDGGGSDGLQADIDKLEASIKTLKNTDAASGPVIGMLPRTISTSLSPKSAIVRDAVNSVNNKNLKLFFGANPTEGERLANQQTQYNDQVEEAENISRITALKERLENTKKLMEEAAEFFRGNKGTLAGFTPTPGPTKKKTLLTSPPREPGIGEAQADAPFDPAAYLSQ